MILFSLTTASPFVLVCVYLDLDYININRKFIKLLFFLTTKVKTKCDGMN